MDVIVYKYILIKVYKKKTSKKKRENVAEALKNSSINYHLLMKTGNEGHLT